MYDKLMNVKEVAEYLNLSEEDVKELVRKGKIPAYKVGGLLLRFKREQVELYRKRSASGATDTQESDTLGNRAESRFAHLIGDQDAGAGRRILKRQGESVPYSFVERLEDFLYYNDFYILSLILLVLVVFTIFEM